MVSSSVVYLGFVKLLYVDYLNNTHYYHLHFANSPTEREGPYVHCVNCFWCEASLRHSMEYQLISTCLVFTIHKATDAKSLLVFWILKNTFMLCRILLSDLWVCTKCIEGKFMDSVLICPVIIYYSSTKSSKSVWNTWSLCSVYSNPVCYGVFSSHEESM